MPELSIWPKAADKHYCYSRRGWNNISSMFCMTLNQPAHQDWHVRLTQMHQCQGLEVLSCFLLDLNYLTGETFDKPICTSTMSSAVLSGIYTSSRVHMVRMQTCCLL